MSSQISDIWKAWINEALPKLAPNDRAKWEISAAIGETGLAFGLFLTMPVPVLETHVQRMVAVDNPYILTKDQVVGLLSRMVADLHAQRSTMLAEAASKGAVPTATKGGIILR